VVQGPCISMKRRPSINQAARWQRQRNFQLGLVPGVEEWPNHISHTESSQMQYACEVEIALKTKYP